MLLCFSQNLGSNTDHEGTRQENQRAQGKVCRSPGVCTPYLKTKTRCAITRHLRKLLNSSQVFQMHLLQSPVLLLGSPLVVQRDLGPNLDITDVNSQMWVTTSRTETESCSEQESCFSSRTLSS